MEKEKYIVESKMRKQFNKQLTLVIKDGSISEKKLSCGLKNKINDYQNQIDSIQIHGLAVSNEFGNDPYIGISQKTLTDAINKIWQKIEEMTGESINGIDMQVSPSYFIGEDSATVHILAQAGGSAEVFEHIALYLNGELLTEADNVEQIEYDVEITETSVFKCIAKVLGIEYTQEKSVTHYSSFWLGAGAQPSDVMTVANLVPIENGMRGAYDVVCAEGQHIIIVMDTSLREGFIRADMNGFEIPFTETTISVIDSEDPITKTYKVFTSVNTYNAGTYNIDING